MILTNARILTFDSSNRVLQSGSVEVRDDGSIGFVRSGRVRGAGTVDLGGRLLMPALINCHTHLYSTLARGMALPGPPPADFPGILKKLWWRLDRALNEEDIYYSALVGLIDSAKCGVGTAIDHHSSPNACAGSLDQVARAFRKVGLRGATCYETSDRNGRSGAAEGIRENVRFIEKTLRETEERRRATDTTPRDAGHTARVGRDTLDRGGTTLPTGEKDLHGPGGLRRVGGEPRHRKSPGGGTVGAAFGLHAAFTLGDRTLRACAEANQPLGAAFHIHVAEDACDRDAVGRLRRFGILNEQTLAAHCIHVPGAQRGILARRGVNAIHNPQSNCNNAVGVANVLDLVRRGVTVGLGSDGYSPRLWDEFKTAFHLQKLQARDPRVAYAEAYAAAFLNNRAIVKKVWGFDIGRIQTGACADLLVADYFPPSPIGRDNLFGHLLFGISNAPVESLIVGGRWVVRDRRCVNVDERRVAEKAAARARALWRRF